ncbi:hypothetical protein PM082_002050 [Marasmius tenuissimus]|nr:hypothetical protein PM082_002050 [Marasmius tenuissimus]
MKPRTDEVVKDERNSVEGKENCNGTGRIELAEEGALLDDAENLQWKERCRLVSFGENNLHDENPRKTRPLMTRKYATANMYVHCVCFRRCTSIYPDSTSTENSYGKQIQVLTPFEQASNNERVGPKTQYTIPGLVEKDRVVGDNPLYIL